MAHLPAFSEIDRDLLEFIEADDAVLLDPAFAVYTNRDLDLSQIELVGFDMDYTLAVYNKQPMEQLQYDLTVERLIQARGYPDEIRKLIYDPGQIVRGLVVDKRTGHLLKLDSHNKVWRAMHGRRQLPREEIDELYRYAKIKVGSIQFPSLDTLFAMPEASLYCNLIDFFEARRARGESLEPVAVNTAAKLFEDVRNSIDEIHSDGTLKSTIAKEISTYIKRDPDIALTLHKLRSVGKRLFLLTNSHWEYTNWVMAYLLDNCLPEYDSWRAYFDIVVVAGSKPRFFVEEHPFKLLEGQEVVAEEFDRTQIYVGGNIRDFERMAKCRGENILYVGDHIYGDILRSKKESLWRTCLILEELPQDIQLALQYANDIDHLSELESERFALDNNIGRHRALLAHIDAKIKNLQEEEPEHELLSRLFRMARIIRREVEQAKRFLRELNTRIERYEDELQLRFHPHWGRLMREHNMLSRFGGQVTWFACIYTGHLTNLLQYSPMHVFRRSIELMSHDWTLLNTKQMRKARYDSHEPNRGRRHYGPSHRAA